MIFKPRLNPLLLYGLAFFLGVAFRPVALLPLCALLLCSQKRFLPTLLLFSTGFMWYHASHNHPDEEVLVGEGILSVSSLSKKTRHQVSRYYFRGTFLEFKSGEKLYKKIPVSFSLAKLGPSHEYDWKVRGSLVKKRQGWVYKPDLDSPWVKLTDRKNFSSLRFHLKEKVKVWLEKSLSHSRVSSLLGGLVTGDFDDRTLSEDFNRFGLSHLLAISGFHFALLAAFLRTFIKYFTQPKNASFLLIVPLGLYFMFLGDSPAVMRAFLMLLVILLSPLFEETPCSEGSLGLGLLLSLLYNPFWAFSLGFQLSFLSTAAILILFPLVDKRLKMWLSPRPSEVVAALGLWQRSGLLVLGFIRQSMSINIAILIGVGPALLYLFHQIPLLSLYYNLFFPFLITLSLFLLLLSIIVPGLHTINSYYTDFILNLTHELPPRLDWTLRTSFFTLEITVILLTLIFYMALHKKSELYYSKTVLV